MLLYSVLFAFLLSSMPFSFELQSIGFVTYEKKKKEKSCTVHFWLETFIQKDDFPRAYLETQVHIMQPPFFISKESCNHSVLVHSRSHTLFGGSSRIYAE
jgi:hypothetical protein